MTHAAMHHASRDPGEMVLMKATYERRTGRPSTVAAPIGQMTIATDYLARLTAQSIALDGDMPRHYENDVTPAGRRIVSTNPDGRPRRFDYDALGRPSLIEDSDVRVTLAYDELSRLVSRTTQACGGKLAERTSYDERGRIAVMRITPDDTDAERRLQFRWRADGKLRQRLSTDRDDRLLRDEVFDYDNRGRLTAHRVAFAMEGEYPRDEHGMEFVLQTFAFDAIDNALAVATTFIDGDIDVASHTYDDVDPDRLVRVSHSASERGVDRVIEYDDNGNVTSDGAGRSFAWDAAGQLHSMMSDSGLQTSYYRGPTGRVNIVVRDGVRAFRYHSDGKVVFETSVDGDRRYVRVGKRVVAELLGTNAPIKVWLLGDDAQGSVVCEQAGKTRTRNYDVYGQRELDVDGARTGFVGEVAEADSGHYFLGDRIYAPSLRRFLSCDTVSPFGAGGLNRYAYCAGDPLNRVDPTGNSWLPVLFSALGFIGALAGAIATGGALSGAVAAAGGGLAAAVSTPTTVALTAAMVADTVSIVAETASIVALANKEDGLATMFGMLALGSGIASVGLSTAVTGLLRTSRFVGSSNLGNRWRTQLTRADDPARVGQASDLKAPPEPVHPPKNRIKVFQELDPKTGESVPHEYVTPNFTSHVHPSNRSSRHFVLDATAKSDYARAALHGIASARKGDPGTRIYIHSGGHGAWTGDLRASGAHARPDARLLGEDVGSLEEWQDIVGDNYRVTIIDQTAFSNAEYRDVLRLSGMHVHLSCYSAADGFLMTELNLGVVPVYRLGGWPPSV